jgi:hypothetical protein
LFRTYRDGQFTLDLLFTNELEIFQLVGQKVQLLGLELLAVGVQSFLFDLLTVLVGQLDEGFFAGDPMEFPGNKTL